MRSFLKDKIQIVSMVTALIFIWAAFYIATDGAFLQARNLSNLFRQSSITAVLSIGMVFVIISGAIDLSIGSGAAVIGAVFATVTTLQGGSVWIGLLAALMTGIALGTTQGAMVSYLKIPPFIVTLGGMMVFRGLSMWITKGNTIPLDDSWVMRGVSGYVGTMGSWCLFVVCAVGSALIQKKSWGAHIFFLLGLGSFIYVMAQYQGIPYPVLLTLILASLFHVVSRRTVFGRQVYAIGGNRQAALLSGIQVSQRSLWVYILMGIMTFVGAILLSARVGSASPDSGQLLELDAVAACVIGGSSLSGGKGSVWGALLGALIMESLNNGMSLANLDAYWQYILKGLVLVAAVFWDVRMRGNQS